MWHLEVINQGEVVYERDDVTVQSHRFNVQSEGTTVPGYTVYGNNSRPIESVGGHEASMELTKEGLVCIKGMWTHFEDRFGDGQGGRLYYGVRTDDGEFQEVHKLPKEWNDPRLQRQWNLLYEGDSGLAIASPALAVAEPVPQPAEQSRERELVHA